MKHFNKLKKIILSGMMVTIFCGCLGTSGLGAKVKKFNLEVVEHRWAREGVFLGLQILWVYRISAVLDLLVFNSIEFWSGENPINGKSPLAEIPLEIAEKIGFQDVEKALIERMDANNAKMQINFENGDLMTFDVVRTDDSYTISYLGKEFFQGTIQDFSAAN
jgi:hypothetical protein